MTDQEREKILKEVQSIRKDVQKVFCEIQEKQEQLRKDTAFLLDYIKGEEPTIN